MSASVESRPRTEHLNSSSPIIHLPDSGKTKDNRKRSDVGMVTTSAKVKVTKKSGENDCTVIIDAGNFNLCRPGKSQEVINGLQHILLEKKEKEETQRRESAKLFLSFIRKRKIKTKPQKAENVKKPDIGAFQNSSPTTEKESDRFGAVRDSIELTRRSLRNSARHWLSDETLLVSLHLIHPGSEELGQPAIHLPPSGACKGQAVTSMTTALPRITPCSTPLPPSLGPVRSHSSASLYSHSQYGAYPPPELSSSVDFANIPKRINPLAPPPPRKRINWTWETTDQHHENEKRRLLMQKREHTRYHSAWSKAFYGSPAEMEAYRRHFREVLKQQMADQDTSKKYQMQEKIKETERAIAYDRECRMNDSQEFFRKHNYLMKFRDGNKNLMENTWDARRYNKRVEDRVDRERLRYNPINWSCSLK